MGTNIFKILKIETKENYHSRFIVEVINANMANKDLFLKMLENATKSQNSRSDFKFDTDRSKLKFKTEKTLPSGPKSRVDIFASDYLNETEGKTRIIIENKIYAGDEKEQLLRYCSYLKTESKKYNGALFYLTIEKKHSTNFSVFDKENKYKFLSEQKRNTLEQGKDYFLLSYKDDIKPWLTQVIEKTDTNEKLKVYIGDYIEIIDELTNYYNMLDGGFSDLDKTNEYKFNTLLELKLWQELESTILNKFESEYYIDYEHRYYNYNKILKAHKPNFNGNVGHEYGIVLNNKCVKDANIRIGVYINKNNRHCLFISKGNFQGNKWEGEKLLIEGVNTNKLIKLSRIKESIDIIEKYIYNALKPI